MLWIVGFMTLAWALLFPRQRKTAHRLEAISRKFPLPHELGGQVGVGAGLPHRALARERVIAEVEIARLLRATVSDLERNTVPTAATATLVLSMRCRIRTIPNRNID